MPDPIKSSTGKATIVKQGHTAGKRYGTDPGAMVKGGVQQPRDLNVK